jgi:hypothetical protein
VVSVSRSPIFVIAANYLGVAGVEDLGAVVGAVVGAADVAVFPVSTVAIEASKSRTGHFDFPGVGASCFLAWHQKCRSWTPCVVYLMERKKHQIQHLQISPVLASEMLNLSFENPSGPWFIMEMISKNIKLSEEGSIIEKDYWQVEATV